MNTDIIFATLDERGIRQQWLADQLDIDKSLLSKYRHGRRPMPTQMATEAARLLGLPQSFLLSASVDILSTEAA